MRWNFRINAKKPTSAESIRVKMLQENEGLEKEGF